MRVKQHHEIHEINENVSYSAVGGGLLSFFFFFLFAFLNNRLITTDKYCQ